MLAGMEWMRAEQQDEININTHNGELELDTWKQLRVDV